jgi:hypothetical protein
MPGPVVTGWVATLLLGTLLLGLELTPREALACSYVLPAPYHVDPAQVGVDVTPPVLSAVRVSELVRGIPGAGGSCGPLKATLALDVDAVDDVTADENLGYRVEVLRGLAPVYIAEPTAYMYYIWSDEPAEPLDFELRVRVLDEAGNESNPVDIRVTDNLDTEDGCSMAPASSEAAAAWSCALAALAWRLRRRPRR